MIWMVDGEGNATFRLRAPLSLFGPQQQGAGSEAIRLILTDIADQGIEVETIGMFTRIRRTPPPGSVEVVWNGKIIDPSQISAAREYFGKLALDYRGSV